MEGSSAQIFPSMANGVGHAMPHRKRSNAYTRTTTSADRQEKFTEGFHRVVRNRVRSAIHRASRRTGTVSDDHQQPSTRYVGPHEWLLRRRLRACDRCCSRGQSSAPFARDAPPWYAACFRVGSLYKRPAWPVCSGGLWQGIFRRGHRSQRNL